MLRSFNNRAPSSCVIEFLSSAISYIIAMGMGTKSGSTLKTSFQKLASIMALGI